MMEFLCQDLKKSTAAWRKPITPIAWAPIPDTRKPFAGSKLPMKCCLPSLERCQFKEDRNLEKMAVFVGRDHVPRIIEFLTK